MLVDPRRIKNVSRPQEPTYWTASGCSNCTPTGCCPAAFRPEADIRRLRSYLRQRSMLVEYASHHIQHMQKALTQMNVKLQHVISRHHRQDWAWILSKPS